MTPREGKGARLRTHPGRFALQQRSITRVPAVHDDRKLPALTTLRIFAAMAVVLCHSAQAGTIYIPDGVVDFLDGGRTAVSLFFCLSGFILAFNYLDLAGPTAVRGFYVSRLARIWPTTLLALAIAVPAVAYAYANRGSGLLLEWYSVSENPLAFLGASFIAQVTMTTGWLPAASLNQPWNGPAWSISCEMFFYLLFPWLIAKFRAWTARRVVLFALALTLAQCVFVFAIAPLAPAGQRGFLVSQFPLAHLLEFVLGVGAGVWFLRGGREWIGNESRRRVLLIVAIGGIVALSLFHPLRPAYLLVTPFFVALVVSLALPPTGGYKVLASRPLLVLGESSFALYLIHVPLLHLYELANAPKWTSWLFLALVVLLSVTIHKFFENPSRRAVRKALSPRRPPSRNAAAGG